MDRLIHLSFLNLDNLYGRWPILGSLKVNDLQLLTVAWNIFLALVPLGLYFLLRKYWRRSGWLSGRQKLAAAVLFIGWLLFFPNTAYILTDVRHLVNFCPADSLFEVCPENAWMIMFFFTYSSLGLIAFYYNLKLMAGLVKEIFNEFWSNLLILLTIPITALGVLLGLLSRLNSWDIILYPAVLAQAIWYYFSQPDYFIDWFIFTIFLYLLYLAADVIFRKIEV